MLKSTIRHIIASTYYATNHYLTRLRGKVIILAYHRVVSENELNQYYIQPGMYVKKDVFEMQMQFLNEHFEIISFAELLDIWEQHTKEFISKAPSPLPSPSRGEGCNTTPPLRGGDEGEGDVSGFTYELISKWDDTKRYCVITFDDGWLDNYIYAYPILKKYNIQATIFLPTSYIGTNQWFWPDKIGYLLRHYYNSGVKQEKREYVKQLCKKRPWINNVRGKDYIEKIDSIIEKCKGLSDEEINDFIEKMSMALNMEIPRERLVLNWEEIREMSKDGISFGSHSINHKILMKLPVDEVHREVEESLCTLQKKRINYIPVFCYPNGNFTDKIIEQVKASEYQAAVSTHFGFEDGFSQNLFGLKRIGIHNDISKTLPLFAYRLSGM